MQSLLATRRTKCKRMYRVVREPDATTRVHSMAPPAPITVPTTP
jgi:hypothetical protein